MSPPNLMAVLQRQAAHYGDKIAFRFCPDGRVETDRLTFRELDAGARAVAADLQQRGAAGKRVLLACEPGLDHIVGYFGCIYAGAIAAPMNDDLPRLKIIAKDLKADFALTTATVRGRVRESLDALTAAHPMQWCTLDPDEDRAGQWVPPAVDPADIALIQYIAEQTKAPKGVLVSHRNLLHNLEAMRRRWNGTDTDISALWLPQQHVMGLVGGALESVYVGCTAVLMAPAAFFTRPASWLEMMSLHRATLTAAPIFAFDLCVKGTSAAQRATLDLSCLEHCWISAGSADATTLANFADAFAPAGFRLDAFQPACGLAESSLMVTGLQSPGLPGARFVDRTALELNEVVDVEAERPDAVALLGSGSPMDDMRVLIVDPDTRLECPADRVGEIWVSGPSVAHGYWGRPEETERTFGARLADTGEGPFLRSGYAGFLCADELFVTGPWRDLVTIRDVAHYPNDIEATVGGVDAALEPGRGAVFTVKPNPRDDEQLVVVQEVRDDEPGSDLSGVVEAIWGAVAAEHGVTPHAVLLVPPRQIPTVNGKIQRNTCRQRYLDGTLDPVAQRRTAEAPHAPSKPTLDVLSNVFKSAIQRRQSAPGELGS